MNEEFNTDSYFQEMFDELTDLMRQEETCFDCEKLRKLTGYTTMKCESHKERVHEPTIDQGRFDYICEQAYRAARQSKKNGDTND